MTDFSELLKQLEEGSPGALDELFRIVDAELRAIAARQLKNERSDFSLQATELVNEAYLRLVGSEESYDWKSRAYFFGAAAEAMRRILVDHARRKRSLKRGGDAQRVDLVGDLLVAEEKTHELLSVHEALDTLEQHNEQAAQLVKLRYFLGLKHHEAAETMQISRRVADKLWLIAKARLFKTLQ